MISSVHGRGPKWNSGIDLNLRLALKLFATPICPLAFLNQQSEFLLRLDSAAFSASFMYKNKRETEPHPSHCFLDSTWDLQTRPDSGLFKGPPKGQPPLWGLPCFDTREEPAVSQTNTCHHRLPTPQNRTKTEKVDVLWFSLRWGLRFL